MGPRDWQKGKNKKWGKNMQTKQRFQQNPAFESEWICEHRFWQSSDIRDLNDQYFHMMVEQEEYFILLNNRLDLFF